MYKSYAGGNDVWNEASRAGNLMREPREALLNWARYLFQKHDLWNTALEKVLQSTDIEVGFWVHHIVELEKPHPVFPTQESMILAGQLDEPLDRYTPVWQALVVQEQVSA